jgi:NAD-dependent deacetylase
MTTIANNKIQGIHQAVDIIRSSKNGVVLTGAGISTASGIPDFRSAASGLWRRYDPFEVASLASFRYHPEKFFNWMRPLAIEIHKAQPNPAHYAIAQLEQAGFVQHVVTQNIDGLHQRAGSKNVIEVHGTLQTMTCVACFRQQMSKGHLETYLDSGKIPRCSYCNNILKPDIILFGEQLPAKAWLMANAAIKKCDFMIVAGSSLEVLPVASLPMQALECGAHLIIINNSQTYLDLRADVVFLTDVVLILPAIANEVLKLESIPNS